MIKLLKFLTTGLIAKLLHCINIGWYSSRVTYVLVGQYEIDVFDAFLMVIIGIFLLYMVIRSPKLEGKAKNAYTVVKLVFHLLALLYICWEGIHASNYIRMCFGLLFYGVIELIIIIAHNINKSEHPPINDKNSLIMIEEEKEIPKATIE